MARYTSAKHLASAMKARARRLKYGRTSIDAASKEAAEIAKAEAVKLTSGPERADGELAAAGHPFKKNRLFSMGENSGVNTKKGTFSFSGLGRFTSIKDKIKGGASTMGSYPLLPIGQKRKKLVKGWRIFRQSDGSYRMQNIDPVSKFVLAPGGTSKMTDRLFWFELNRRVVPKIRRAGLQIKRLALKG